mgnify:CR=1 FL=1
MNDWRSGYQEHIWELAAQKLSKEATETELCELDELLQQNPATGELVKLIYDWWDEGYKQSECDNQLLFEKVLDQIKKQ